MKKVGAAVLVVALWGGGAGAVRAEMVPITVDGGWRSFWWHDAPKAWNDDGHLTPYNYVTFTYDSPAGQWTRLKVTDDAIAGDRFEVFDGAASLGLTSVPVSGTVYPLGVNPADYNWMSAHSQWSSGAFLLGPGGHAIRIHVVQSAAGLSSNKDGDGGLRVDSMSTPVPVPVPVPAAGILGILGFGLSGWLLRRQAA